MVKHVPKVSVCVPTCNRVKLLRIAIESVIIQNYGNFELLIVDNASTDNTEQIVSKYKILNKRIRYFRNNCNIGFVGNLQKCLELSEGEYVIFIGDDDIMLPNTLRLLVEFMESHSNVGICTANLYTFSTYPNKPERIYNHFNSDMIFNKGYDALVNWLWNSNLGSMGGYIFRKETAVLCGGFDKEFVILPQFSLGGKISTISDVGHLPVYSMAQRVSHDKNQLAIKQYTNESSFLEVINILNKLLYFAAENNVIDLKKVRSICLKRIVSGYLPNLPSFKLYGSYRAFFLVVKHMVNRYPLILVDPRFLFYFSITMLFPDPLLFSSIKLYKMFELFMKKWIMSYNFCKIE